MHNCYLNARAPRLSYFLVPSLGWCRFYEILTTNHTSVHLCQSTSHLQTTLQDLNSIGTCGQMSFPRAHVPLAPALLCLPLLDSLLSLFKFISYLSFLNCASCQPCLLVFLSCISYSSLQPTPGFQYLVSPISLASNISMIQLFFFEPISLQTTSHATVLIAPTAIFSHPILQPVTPLLRSIIMAQLT